MDPLRILHLSDIHIALPRFSLETVIRSRSTAQQHIVEQIAYFAWSKQAEIDAILITGDIVDNGKEENLEEAAKFLNNPPGPPPTPFLYKGKEPTLLASNTPIIILPGNHDRYCNVVLPTGSKTFDTNFYHYWDKGHGGFRCVRFSFQQKPPVAIVCIDFCLDINLLDELRAKKSLKFTEAYFEYFGQGEVRKNVIDDVKQKTLQLQQENYHVIWAIHFAPQFELEETSFDPRLKLLNSDFLLKAATKVNVEHIFCGHTHDSKIYTPKSYSKVKIYCAGTATCTSSKDDTSFFVHKLMTNRQSLIVNSTKYTWFQSPAKNGYFIDEPKMNLSAPPGIFC